MTVRAVPAMGNNAAVVANFKDASGGGLVGPSIRGWISRDDTTRILVFTDKDQANERKDATRRPPLKKQPVIGIAGGRGRGCGRMSYPGCHLRPRQRFQNAADGGNVRSARQVQLLVCSIVLDGEGEVTSINGLHLLQRRTSRLRVRPSLPRRPSDRRHESYLAFGVWLTESSVHSYDNSTTYTFGAFADGGAPVAGRPYYCSHG